MTAALISAAILLANVPTHSARMNRSCASSTAGAGTIRVHGRLAVYNGGYPNFRLWWIGTHHLFGIYNDSADMQCQRGGQCSIDEDTRMPANLESMFTAPDVFKYSVYGNFQLRLLEPHKSGHMQAACVISAHELVRRVSD